MSCLVTVGHVGVGNQDISIVVSPGVYVDSEGGEVSGNPSSRIGTGCGMRDAGVEGLFKRSAQMVVAVGLVFQAERKRLHKAKQQAAAQPLKSTTGWRENGPEWPRLVFAQCQYKGSDD